MPRQHSQFQSAPAIAGGRFASWATPPARSDGFNPRPPLLAGVSRLAMISPFGPMRFQSAPAVAGGRFQLPSVRRVRWFAFQSAPAIAGGRFAERVERGLLINLFQSAPAIAGGRFGNITHRLHVALGFNPRPPLLAGVSPEAQAAAAIAWFQSAPAIAGGRFAARDAVPALLSEFQSAPAIAGGRFLRERLHEAEQAVSIRARHCWRAFLSSRGNMTADSLFQSAPAIAGGRFTAARR